MSAYLLRRVAVLVPVLCVISLLAFGLIQLAPGDPARVILQRQGTSLPTPAELAAVREELGLDDAFGLRYGRWVARTVRGDLGVSSRTGRPVAPELVVRFLRTLELAVPAFVLGLLIAVPLGLVSALRRNRVTDHVARVGALIAASMPSFWLGYLVIIVFAVRLGLFPVAGRGTWRHLVLPTLTLGLGAAAGMMRLTRASVLDVLSADHVRTAEAYGLRPGRVLASHVMKNASIPILTLAGLRFGTLLGGAVIVETVFAWPGLGKHIVDSIYDRDYTTIQGFVLLIGTVFVVVNLLIDVAYVWLDPRVRLGAKVGSDRDR